MKTKTTALLLSLVLSFGLLAQRLVADDQPGQGQQPIVYETITYDHMVAMPLTSYPRGTDLQPVIYTQRFETGPQTLYGTQPVAPDNGTTPSAASSDDSQSGMNLNFIPAATFPQKQDTFVPLTHSLLDEDIWDHIFDHPVVLTQRNAIENTTAENIITIPQGRAVVVNLGKTWIQASYDSSKKDYIWSNSWSFEKDNQNMKDFGRAWFDGAWIGFPKASKYKNQLRGGRLCQKWHIYFPFQAVSLGETTLTFTRQDALHAEPKILTFRFNVVEAPAAPATSDNGEAGGEK